MSKQTTPSAGNPFSEGDMVDPEVRISPMIQDLVDLSVVGVAGSDD
jgi:hypothetical protein